MPYQPLYTARVLVMERLDGRPLATIDPGTPAGCAPRWPAACWTACSARSCWRAPSTPTRTRATSCCWPTALGLLDFGSVGRIDAGLRTALQRLLLALDRGDPARLADALLEVLERPGELDEPRLERCWAGSWPGTPDPGSPPT